MSDHPLLETFRRGRDRTHRGCSLGPLPATAAQTPARALVEDPAELARALGRVGAEVGTTRLDVAGSLLLEAYAWGLLLPVVGALVAERRAPLPTLDDVKLPAGVPRPSSVALSACAFAALDGDPAATHADAVVVADEGSLTAALRSSIVAHFGLLAPALNAASGRSRAALWRTICDRGATAFLYAGAACGEQARADELAVALFDGRGPLRTKPRYVVALDERGTPERRHERHGCCLWWRTRAATTCVTCPLGSGWGAPRISRGACT